MSCISPFLPAADYANSTGFVAGRFCSDITGTTCCLPCPITDWVYPDSFNTLSVVADWVAVASTVCCVFLLVSWLALPVDKTNCHYLSICLTIGITFMNLGFIIPLAGRPDQCSDAITPHGIKSSTTCAASGAFLLLGGWSGVLWVFLRSLSLHLQICWQVVVGRTFMWTSQAVGWGIPVIGVTLALVLSGASFRFGTTCHIDHKYSLAVLWIPLLTFSALTIVVQLITFGYCIKVYLVSLADSTASTENSGLPSYANSIRTMTPRQAYRRVRRVIQLQWRGIAIVLIIITDVVFFSVVFVFQDNTVENVTRNPAKARPWLVCLATHSPDKTPCLHLARSFMVKEATIGAVLVLLAMNGFWLLFLLGRWSMVHGWIDLIMPSAHLNKREFVSVDARMDNLKKDTRSYEMLSGDHAPGAGGPGSVVTISSILKKDLDVVTSVPPAATTTMTRSKSKSKRTVPTFVPATRSPSSLGQLSEFDHSSTLTPAVARTSGDRHYNSNTEAYNVSAPAYTARAYAGHDSQDFSAAAGTTTTTATAVPSGRRTPDYFGQTARYNPPARSYSNSRPPTVSSAHNSPPGTGGVQWDSRDSFARAASPPQPGSGVRTNSRFGSRSNSRTGGGVGVGVVESNSADDIASRHPLGMNRI